MKTLLLLFFVAVLAGCSHKRPTNEDILLWKWAWANGYNAGRNIANKNPTSSEETILMLDKMREDSIKFVNNSIIISGINR